MSFKNLKFYPNFQLNSQKLIGKRLKEIGIYNFHSIIEYVYKLPYSRISNLDDLLLTISEKKGTCSTKHGFLKAVAEENEQEDIRLHCVYFEFSKKHIPTLIKEFEKLKLQSELEGHCYLSYNNHILDVTTTYLDYPKFIDFSNLYKIDDLKSYECGEQKQKRHLKLFKEWCQEKEVDFEKAWDLRWKVIKELVTMTKRKIY